MMQIFGPNPATKERTTQMVERAGIEDKGTEQCWGQAGAE